MTTTSPYQYVPTNNRSLHPRAQEQRRTPNSEPQDETPQHISTHTNLELLTNIINSQSLGSNATINSARILRTRLLEQLSNYFAEPTTFLETLANTSGIITGSWALAFILSSQDWSIKDLDVLVPSHPNAPEDEDKGQPNQPYIVSSLTHSRMKLNHTQIMKRFLTSTGYTLKARFPIYEADEDDLPLIQYTTTYTNTTLGTQVDVIESHTQFAMDTLLRFHSTIVMNGISATHIIIMFPQWTRDMKSLAKRKKLPTLIEMKYTQRGVEFKFEDDLSTSPCELACPSLVRGTRISGTTICAAIALTHLEALSSEFPPWKTWKSPVECTNPKCPNAINLEMM